MYCEDDTIWFRFNNGSGGVSFASINDISNGMPKSGGMFTGNITISDSTYGHVGYIKGDVVHNIRLRWADNDGLYLQVNGVEIGKFSISK